MTDDTAPVGFIADDITGATDLASALAGRDIDTRLVFADAPMPADGCDAIVVALKIRSVPAADARAAATRAADALRSVGARQLFSKYCSTFDSTTEGNIGPIADALAAEIGAGRMVHCPAYPTNGRTVYLSHLFVGDELLADSPMRDHPLNPMRDSQLVRVLGAQTSHRVSAVRWPVVDAGSDAVAAHLTDAGRDITGPHHVIADAVRDTDLETVANAIAGDRLAGGSAAFGAAFAVASLAHRGRTFVSDTTRAPVPVGPTAILAGSLSRATREQVQMFDGMTVVLDHEDLMAGADAAMNRALDAVRMTIPESPVLITTEHDVRARNEGGAADISARIERTMGRLAAALVDLGVRRLIVAGGETSGAVAAALAMRSARIGPDIDVGVPWVVDGERAYAVAFKSGNFGKPTFFRDAMKAADA